MKRDPQRRTLILSVFFSAFGPLVTAWALTMNASATQLADFLRRSLELGVLIFALYIYILVKRPNTDLAQKKRLETIHSRLAAMVLWIGACILLGLFIQAIRVPSVPEGTVIPGISIAVLGVIFNGSFYFRYRRFNENNHDAIMAAQAKIYQAKTVVDINVVIALGSVWLIASPQISTLVDMIGSLVIALYLFVRGALLFRHVQPPYEPASFQK